jgi:intein/homing endonuclease/ribosomal protein L37AE/L43A
VILTGNGQKRLVSSDTKYIMYCCQVNQEDGIMANQSAIDRGLFLAKYLKKIIVELKKNPSTSLDDKFGIPNSDTVSGMSGDNYDKLNAKGHVPERVEVENGDALIGKITPQNKTGVDVKPFKDTSQIYGSSITSIVDKVDADLVNLEGYGVTKMRLNSLRTPSVGDKVACYDERTDVLTNLGWIPFRLLTVSHKVATLHYINDKHVLKYEHPTEIMRYDHDGDMYKIQNNQIDLLVTLNHKMYVRTRYTKRGCGYKLERADKIMGLHRHYKKDVDDYEPDLKLCPEIKGDKFYLKSDKNEFDSNDMKKFMKDNHDLDSNEFIKKLDSYDKKHVLGMELDLKAWCQFFGVWIAEGCTVRDWGVQFSANKPRVKALLTKCCKKLGFEIHKHKTGRDKDGNYIRNAWCVNNREVTDYIYPLSLGAVNKSLPEWCFYLPKKYASALLDGMLCGDGETMKGTVTRRYYTSSRRLVDDVQTIALHAGFACNYRMRYEAGHTAVGKTKTITTTEDAYTLTIVSKQTEPAVNRDVKNPQDKIINYKGQIYCCTVSTGVIYVRRNGLAKWAGNSSHAQKSTIGVKFKQEDMPFTIPVDNKGNYSQTIIPDLIMNPNAIPSRMTIAHILECLLGKIAARKGYRIDGTPFTNINVEEYGDLLEELGFTRYGNHRMINGQTGREFDTTIFIGPTYYQRLKHLVFDKYHARARGPRQVLTRQPTEGRSRDGGLRIGTMEADQHAAGTPISLGCGLSIPIEQMYDNNYKVISWDQHAKQIMIKNQTNFLNRGIRPTMKITLEDGTTMKTGFEHPHLTKECKWIKSKDLKIGDKLQCSIKGPVMDLDKELKKCKRFTLETDGYTYSARNKTEYFKLLAFARIVGIAVTDGHVPNESLNGSLFVAHSFDVAVILDDIKILTNRIASTFKSEISKTHSVVIRLPIELTRSLVSLPGFPRGKKVESRMTIPVFIEDWPKSVIREFLGSLFGGDGHVSNLNSHGRGKDKNGNKSVRRDMVSSINFSKSKMANRLDNLKLLMKRVQGLLAKFGIHNVTIRNPEVTTISKTKAYVEKHGQKCYSMLLHICNDDLIKFADEIGFRYCSAKTMRLMAVASYRRLQYNVCRQMNLVIDRVKEITEYNDKTRIKGTWEDATNKAHKELKKKEPIYNNYFSLPSGEMIRSRLKNKRIDIKLQYEHFPTAGLYFKQIGALEWFMTKDKIKNDDKKLNGEDVKSKSYKVAYANSLDKPGLPTFNLKIIGIETIEDLEGYDIEVAGTENYVANGVVTHNCLISHGGSQLLKEMMLDKSDIYSVYVCDICGRVANKMLAKEIYECPSCPSTTDMTGNNTTRISKIVIPYTFKLLSQELLSMMIDMRLRLKKTIFNTGMY